MSMLQTILGGAAAKATGWALIHVLWQASLIALILGAALLALRNRSANVRYVASCMALAATIALPVATGILSYEALPDRSPLVPVEAAATSGSPGVDFLAEETPLRAPTLTERISNLPVEPALPWVVAIWLAGVTVLSLRIAYGLTSVSRMGRLGTSPVPASVERTMNELAGLMGLKRAVTILRSRRIEVPTVIGWLEPVILVPASALSGLTPHQLRTILAHELAHVRRHDFAVNLAQTAIETLLFFHPAVWWISRQVRVEREHCCDDIAVALCGDPIDYARALATMEELRSAMLPAMAASGGSLNHRIRRLLGIRSNESEAARPALAVAAALGITMAAVLPIFAGSYIYDVVVTPVAPGERMVVLGDPDEDLDEIVDSVIDAHLLAADAEEIARQISEEQLARLKAEAERVREIAAGIDDERFARLEELRAEVERSRATEFARLASVTANAQLERERQLARLEAAMHKGEHDLDDRERAELEELRREVRRTEVEARALAEALADRYADYAFVLATAPPAPPMPPAFEAPAVAPVAPVPPAVPAMPAPPAPPSFAFAFTDDGDAPVIVGRSGRRLARDEKPLDPANPSVDDLIFLKTYGIDADYVREMQAAGLKNLTARELAILHTYNVSPETVRELRSFFGDDLSAAKIGAMAGVGIDASWLREMRASGLELTPSTAIRMRSAGLDAESLEALNELLGGSLSTTEAIRLRNAGVDAAYLQELAGVGLDDLSASELWRLRSTGVDAEWVKQIRSSGLTGLDAGDYAKLKSVGVDGTYVASVRRAGYPEITAGDLMRLKTMGIDAGWIDRMNGARGATLSVRDLLRLKSAGIDSDYLEHWK